MPRIRSVPGAGAQLRVWRRHHGVTQSRLAASLGVSASTVGRWERINASLKSEIRDFFPNPPGLTLGNGSPPPNPRPANMELGVSIAQQAAHFQVQYATAIQRALEPMAGTVDFTAIRRSVDSLAAHIAPIAQALHASPLLEGLANYQSLAGQMTASFNSSFLPIIQQATRAFQDIIAAFPTAEEAKGVSRVLADRGWFVGREFPMGMLLRVDALLAEDDPEGVETIMQHYVRAHTLDIVAEAENRCPDRAAILRSAAAAHQEGRFELSVPVLLAQADGMARDILGGHIFLSRGGKGGSHKRTLAGVTIHEKAGALGINPDHGWLAVTLAPIYDGASLAVQTDVRDLKRVDDRLYGPLNRHGVLHGLDTDYGTEGNSLRAFLLVDYVLSLDGVLDGKQRAADRRAAPSAAPLIAGGA